MKSMLVIVALAVVALVVWMTYQRQGNATNPQPLPPYSHTGMPLIRTTGNPWVDTANQVAPYGADIVRATGSLVQDVGRSNVIGQIGALPGQVVSGVLQPVVGVGRAIVNAPVNFAKDIKKLFKR